MASPGGSSQAPPPGCACDRRPTAPLAPPAPRTRRAPSPPCADSPSRPGPATWPPLRRAPARGSDRPAPAAYARAAPPESPPATAASSRSSLLSAAQPRLLLHHQSHRPSRRARNRPRRFRIVARATSPGTGRCQPPMRHQPPPAPSPLRAPWSVSRRSLRHRRAGSVAAPGSREHGTPIRHRADAPPVLRRTADGVGRGDGCSGSLLGLATSYGSGKCKRRAWRRHAVGCDLRFFCATNRSTRRRARPVEDTTSCQGRRLFSGRVTSGRISTREDRPRPLCALYGAGMVAAVLAAVPAARAEPPHRPD